MKYVVLYQQKIEHRHEHNGYYSTINETRFETFEDKQAAIDCALLKNGVIVEAFEFDIKKEKA